MLQQAFLFHQQGRLSEAAALYRKILEREPLHADALHLLGVIELQRRNPTEALDLIGRAIQIHSGNAAFFSNRGVALQDLRRFEEALESFDRALSIRPGAPEVLNNRGTVLRELNRPEDSLASYDQALASNPAYAEALNNRGNVLCDRARHEEALESFDRAIAIEPHYADAYSNRGVVLHLLKRVPEAIESYEKATALSPNQASAHNHLGNLLAGQSRFDDAVARYEHALAANPNYVEAHLNLAKVLKRQNRIEAAISHYRRAVELAPNYVEGHLNLAEALLDLEQRQEALQAAEAAERLEEESNFPHFALGVVLARLNRADAARRHLRHYLEEDIDDHRSARLILAGLEGGALPERASRAHLLDLYAARAERWRGGDITYRGHELAANAIKQFSAAAAPVDILDAGCGTGLVGPLVRDIAGRIDGVDLSASMLESAKQKAVYDALYEGDLVEFLQSHPSRYDVVVSAATLIHFGDLTPVIRAAASSLRSNGLFVFTLFPNEDGRDFAVAPLGGLGEGGCYLHGRDYLKRVAGETGFSVALLETGVHEYDNKGAPIAGLIVALRRENAG